MQRKLARTIKHAKALNLFPYKGLVKPTDKMPLMSNFEDLEEFNKKHVNPITGTIYRTKDIKMNSDRERIKERLDPEEVDHVSAKKVKDSEKLKIDDMPSVTSSNQIRWLKAQQHLISKEKNIKDGIKGTEKAYESVSKEIDGDFRVDILPELFIHERAMKVEKIERNYLL